MKTDLKNLFATLQSDMISKANFSTILNHPTDRGDNSEESWIKWFCDYLPKRYKAAKATIIDSNGNISNQIDLVVYDAQYSYLAFNENDILYIPAESVRKLYRTSVTIPHNLLAYMKVLEISTKLLV